MLVRGVVGACAGMCRDASSACGDASNGGVCGGMLPIEDVLGCFLIEEHVVYWGLFAMEEKSLPCAGMWCYV